MVDRRLAIDLDLFSRGGMRVLEKIERQDYDVLARAAGDFERSSACGCCWARWLAAHALHDAWRRPTHTARGVARTRAKNFYYSFLLLLAANSATPCARSTRSCATATI